MKSIFIIENNKVIKEGIKKIVSDADQFVVVGDSRTGLEGIKLIEQRNPDIVLLEYSLPDVTGMSVARYFAKKKSIKFLFYTDFFDPCLYSRAIITHTAGFLMKNSSCSLIDALRFLADGKKYLQPDISYDLVKYAISEKKFQDIDDREYEILYLYANGSTNEEISERLNVSLKTIQNVRQQILKKIGTADKAEIQQRILYHQSR